MLTSTQKQTAEAIINLFETSEVLGDYSKVTLIEGDSGHLTYGRSQTTLGSGNLHILIDQYCARHDARFRDRLHHYLPRIAERDLSLDRDWQLHNLLRASADDPVMRDTQDAFFDEHYWQRAAAVAEGAGITSPLGMAVVYDSFIHGSWERIHSRTCESLGGEAHNIGEKSWITEYVRIRRSWLAGHSRHDLRATTYRMDTFLCLIELGLWALELPMVVRGKEISSVTLNMTPPNCFDGPVPGSRVIALETPLQKGLDVRLLQIAISDAAIEINADGIFGPASARCLREYQKHNNSPQTGVAGQELLAALLH